jgi:hypothetical protein
MRDPRKRPPWVDEIARSASTRFRIAPPTPLESAPAHPSRRIATRTEVFEQSSYTENGEAWNTPAQKQRNPFLTRLPQTENHQLDPSRLQLVNEPIEVVNCFVAISAEFDRFNVEIRNMPS